MHYENCVYILYVMHVRVQYCNRNTDQVGLQLNITTTIYQSANELQYTVVVKYLPTDANEMNRVMRNQWRVMACAGMVDQHHVMVP